MSKVLITSGCSFSETASPESDNWVTWPWHLYQKLQQHGYNDFRNCAMGSQGNGLISRGIIYNVIKALETYKPEDILVGVMWSGSNRHDYRTTRTDLLSFGTTNTDGWIENPTGLVSDSEKKWVILNHGWTTKESEVYYKYFFDYIGHWIYSIEHVLRTQYFLKSKNIKYFFTNFADNNIVDWTSMDYKIHKSEIDYLYNEIDQSYYLPVSSEHRWVYENSTTKEEFRQKHFVNNDWSYWIHPNRQQHQEFTNQVIYPYLSQKNYI